MQLQLADRVWIGEDRFGRFRRDVSLDRQVEAPFFAVAVDRDGLIERSRSSFRVVGDLHVGGLARGDRLFRPFRACAAA